MSVSNVGFRAVVVLAAALLAVLMVSSAGEAQGKGVRDVTAMSYNIHHGVGADGRLNLDRIAGVVRAEKAEVVGLQEVDRFWRRSDFVDQVEYLARELGMQAAYGANLDLSPDDPLATAPPVRHRHPQQVPDPRDREHLAPEIRHQRATQSARSPRKGQRRPRPLLQHPPAAHQRGGAGAPDARHH